MTRVSLLYILCQCSSLTELETMARELGCVDLHIRYGALHLMLPDGTRGSLRWGTSGYRWCAADSAE